MIIKLDDLTDPKIEAFLKEHVEEMKSISPPESKHALDIDGLKQRDISFWSVWDDSELVAVGAIKKLNGQHAEIKSMRVAKRARGKGIASMLLRYIIEEAKSASFERLSLETGSMEFFEPARSLYRQFGFEICEPFADYQLDPNSVFMSLRLVVK